MPNVFVPASFDVPESWVTDGWVLAVLEPSVAALDYDAVMSSAPALHSVFAAHHDWPEPNLTLADNVRDLELHAAEFARRQAFAYTVLDPARTRCLGCVYLYPSGLAQYDCEAYFWLRTDEHASTPAFTIALKAWLEARWPFGAVALPGREIPWDQWPAGPRRALGADL